LLGYAEGLKHFGEVRIDKNAIYFSDTLSALDLYPKYNIDVNSNDLFKIDTIIEKWEVPQNYWVYFPTGMLVTKSNFLIKIIQIFRFFLKNNNLKNSIKLIFIFFSKSIIYRLQKI
jgi:hypothetical protein